MKSTKILAILLVGVMSFSLLATVVKPDKVPKAFEAIWDALVDLQGQIDQEIANLQAALNQEISDRIADVDVEEAARIAANDALQNLLEAAIASGDIATADAAQAANDALQSALEAAIAAEESTRAAADNALQSDLGTEAAARANADTALQTALNQEISSRIADVHAEEAARIADVDAEEAARIAEDGTLQAQIDAIQPIPAGVIVMWSGSIGDIPDGWALCDGSDGTPDLTDRFIYGVSDGEDPGATFGSAIHSHSYSDVPVHTHSITDPGHSHSYKRSYVSMLYGYSSGSEHITDHIAYGSTNPSVTHITINSTGVASPTTDSASSLPPYYKLAYIMKL